MTEIDLVALDTFLARTVLVGVVPIAGAILAFALIILILKKLESMLE